MKQQIAATVLFLAATTPAFAVDKQLSQMEGVNRVDIYLEHSVINMRMSEGRVV